MSDKLNDELKTIRFESQKAIGQAIVSSLIKKENYVVSDFQQFIGTTSYYNQSGGNYTQTDGGNYTQNGGGNYTQSPKTAISLHDAVENIALFNSIREMGFKG